MISQQSITDGDYACSSATLDECLTLTESETLLGGVALDHVSAVRVANGLY
jgi:hypothetical protein